MKVAAFVVALLGGCTGMPPDTALEPIHVDITPYPYNTDVTGADLPVEIGRFTVPANRQRPDGPGFIIGFVRYPAADGVDGPPVVFLTSNDSPSLSRQALYAALRQLGDVVVLHRRGYGFSSPPAPCRQRVRYAFDEALNVDRLTTRARQHATDCWDALAASGSEKSYYSNREVAADLADLPRALGVKAVALIAENELALPAASALQRYPDRFTRAVLVNSLPGIRNGAAFERTLAELCKAASRDSCVANLELLLAALETPRTIELLLDGGRTLPVTLDSTGAGVLAGRALRGGSSALLGFADDVEAASVGNDEPLARSILAARRDLGQPDLLAMHRDTGGGDSNDGTDFDFGLAWPVSAMPGDDDGAPPERSFSMPVLHIDGSLAVDVPRGSLATRTDILVAAGDRQLLETGNDITRVVMKFIEGQPITERRIDVAPSRGHD